MKRALWRTWMRLRRALGYPGIVGIALLLPAAALAIWLPRFQQEAKGLTDTLQQRTRIAMRHQVSASREPSDADVMREFVTSFPPMDRNKADLEAIFAAAAQRKVMLPKGEYQLKVDPNSPLTTYTATFPIRSDYATLKDFSADVLTAMPHVSMDEFHMSRDGAASTSLDAVLRFTLFYRSP
jgi:hypothetical protein